MGPCARGGAESYERLKVSVSGRFKAGWKEKSGRRMDEMDGRGLDPKKPCDLKMNLNGRGTPNRLPTYSWEWRFVPSRCPNAFVYE